MNVTLTCKCGKKFTVNLQDAGKEAACPGCGRRAKIPTPPPLPSLELDTPSPQLLDIDDDAEIRLQELPTPPRSTPTAARHEIEESITLKPLDPPLRDQTQVSAMPMPPTVIEVDDDGGYGVDKERDASGIENGTGVYGTLSTIPLDEEIPCIAYGARGNWALAGQGSDVLVINMKTKKPTKFFEEHDGVVTSVALSATEPLALSADEDGILYVWDAVTFKRKKKIVAHDYAICAAALAPNGKFAASGGEDSYIHLWDLATGKRRDLEHNDWDQWEEVATYVAFSRDSKKLLAGGSGGRVCVWSVETGERIKRYAGLDLPISCLRLSDEGGKLTAATHPVRDGGTNYLVVCHWDTKTGKPKDHFNIAIDSTPCCMVPDRNGSRIFIAGGGAEPWMGVWSLERGQCKHVYDDLAGSPISLAVSPLNNRVIAALHNEQIQLFGIEPF
jgi:WD40 repeat protein